MSYYYLIYALAGYLIGSIPFGYLIVKITKGIDVRTVGSGNIGATNVARVAGIGNGILCFSLDTAKGFFPTFVAVLIHPVLIGRATLHMSDGLTAGLGIIIGHLFPIYIGFKGGKGVATSLGVFLLLTYFTPAAAAVTIWIVVFLFTRYVSVASMIAAMSLPIGYWLNLNFKPEYWEKPVMFACLLVAILVVVRHIPNIKRLVNGTEPRVTLFKKGNSNRTNNPNEK